MEKKDQNNQEKSQEKNLSELMEFDFDDILMDEAPVEHRAENRGAQKMNEERPKDPILSEEEKQKQIRRAKKKRRRRGFKIGIDIVTWIKDIAIAVVVEDSGAGSTYAVPIAEKIFDLYFK